MSYDPFSTRSESYSILRQVRNAGVRCTGSRCQVPGSRFQVRRFQVPGPRCQVPGSRCQGSGARCQIPDSMCQVPGSMCHAPGICDHIARDHVSDFGGQVPRQNVEHLHIKNIARLNGNYKLLLRLNGNCKLTNAFFTTLTFYLARFRKTKKKTPSGIFLDFCPQIR